MRAAHKPVRVAILGACGIGQVHAGIFHELGAQVCAVLGSSAASATAAANALSQALGAPVRGFHTLDHLLDEGMDAVSICTPPRLHFEQLQAAMLRHIPAFCEKPLFWNDGLTPDAVAANLDVLEQYPDHALCVNTSNAAFVDAVASRMPSPHDIHDFHFRFHTNGSWQGDAIGADLMPHGLSLLIRLLGVQPPSQFRAVSSGASFACAFHYGACAVTFDFAEGRDIPKALSFRVNGHEFRRRQTGQGNSYRVDLFDVRARESIPVEDPFRRWISRFLARCRGEAAFERRDLLDATANLRLMAQVLIPLRDVTGHLQEQ